MIPTDFVVLGVIVVLVLLVSPVLALAVFINVRQAGNRRH